MAPMRKLVDKSMSSQFWVPHAVPRAAGSARRRIREQAAAAGSSSAHTPRTLAIHPIWRFEQEPQSGYIVADAVKLVMRACASIRHSAEKCFRCSGGGPVVSVSLPALPCVTKEAPLATVWN